MNETMKPIRRGVPGDVAPAATEVPIVASVEQTGALVGQCHSSLDRIDAALNGPSPAAPVCGMAGAGAQCVRDHVAGTNAALRDLVDRLERLARSVGG